MRTPGSATELEARRRRAAEWFQERKPLREIADHFGVSFSSVKRWKRAWKSGGVDALAAKPHPGGVSKLSRKQKLELVDILLAGPLSAGYRTDLWTCARVAEVIRKRFGVQYHPGHLSRILHDLGFSPQKTRPTGVVLGRILSKSRIRVSDTNVVTWGGGWRTIQ